MCEVWHEARVEDGNAPAMTGASFSIATTAEGVVLSASQRLDPAFQPGDGSLRRTDRRRRSASSYEQWFAKLCHSGAICCWTILADKHEADRELIMATVRRANSMTVDHVSNRAVGRLTMDHVLENEHMALLFCAADSENAFGEGGVTASWLPTPRCRQKRLASS